jgi:hypothetical protein
MRSGNHPRKKLKVVMDVNDKSAWIEKCEGVCEIAGPRF